MLVRTYFNHIYNSYPYRGKLNSTPRKLYVFPFLSNPSKLKSIIVNKHENLEGCTLKMINDPGHINQKIEANTRISTRCITISETLDLIGKRG